MFVQSFIRLSAVVHEVSF